MSFCIYLTPTSVFIYSIPKYIIALKELSAKTLSEVTSYNYWVRRVRPYSEVITCHILRK